MKPVVTVVDYDVGNLLSVARAFEHCGAEVRLESSPLFVAKAERLVLPGVGAFGDCIGELQARGLAGPIKDYAASGRPMLGICVGMQMLFEGSEEFGRHAGLGIVRGWVRKLPQQPGLKLPHIGWSPIAPPSGQSWHGSILEGLPSGQEVYFVHSFAGCPEEPADRLAETPYGEARFCAVVRRGSVTGCQFHPEKSGEAGLSMIRRFLAS